MAGSARRSEVGQRLAVRRPGWCREQPAVEQHLRWTQRGAGERSNLELRGLFPTGADHRELRAVRRERRLAAVIRLAGERLGDGKRTALVVDLRSNGGGGFDGMPDEEEPSTGERNRTDVAAGVVVRRGPSARLRLRPVERHAPDRHVDLVAVLRAVEAVHERRAIGGDLRVERPMVAINDSGIVFRQALDDMSVEIQQVEVDTRPEGEHHRKKKDGGDPPNDHGKFALVTARISVQWGIRTLCPPYLGP